MWILCRVLWSLQMMTTSWKSLLFLVQAKWWADLLNFARLTFTYGNEFVAFVANVFVMCNFLPFLETRECLKFLEGCNTTGLHKWVCLFVPFRFLHNNFDSTVDNAVTNVRTLVLSIIWTSEKCWSYGILAGWTSERGAQRRDMRLGGGKSCFTRRRVT